MAINVGSVYLSTSIDSKGLEKDIAYVRSVTQKSFGEIGRTMAEAFTVNPSFNLESLMGAVSEGVTRAAFIVGPFIDALADSIRKGAKSAIESLSGISQYVGSVFARQWDRSWTAMGEGFTGVWRGVANFFTGCVNGMINGINTVFAGLNKISVKMPDWMGGKSFGFNLPILGSIPYLAKGGIVSQPTLAMIGERGREAVMPLENNTAWITDLANRLGAVIAAREAYGGGRQAGGGVVNLYIDGRKFAEATIDDFSQVSHRRGINLL